MTKQEAIELFGTRTKLCDTLCIQKTTFYRWPDPLPIQKEDQVRGAYFRVAEQRDRLLVHSIGG